MVTSGFFNSVNGDRKYSAEQMSELFNGIINDGVFINIGTAFEVKADVGNQVTVGIGRAWFDSAWVKNDTILVVELGESDILTDRIDAVVIEVDHSAPVRDGNIKVIEGTAQTNPVRPTMEHSFYVNQYPLAYILRPKNSTAITQANITYMVGTSETPFVTGILETLNIDALVAQWGAEWGDWFDGIKDKTTGDIIEYQDAWDQWFQGIRDELTEDAAGNLQLQIQDIRNSTVSYGSFNPTTAGWYRIALCEETGFVRYPFELRVGRTHAGELQENYRFLFTPYMTTSGFIGCHIVESFGHVDKTQLFDKIRCYRSVANDKFFVDLHLKTNVDIRIFTCLLGAAYKTVSGIVAIKPINSVDLVDDEPSSTTDRTTYTIKPNISGDLTQYLPLSGGTLNGNLNIANNYELAINSAYYGENPGTNPLNWTGTLVIKGIGVSGNASKPNSIAIRGMFEDHGSTSVSEQEFIQFNSTGMGVSQPTYFNKLVSMLQPLLINGTYIAIGDFSQGGTRIMFKQIDSNSCAIQFTYNNSDWITCLTFRSGRMFPGVEMLFGNNRLLSFEDSTRSDGGRYNFRSISGKFYMYGSDSGHLLTIDNNAFSIQRAVYVQSIYNNNSGHIYFPSSGETWRTSYDDSTWQIDRTYSSAGYQAGVWARQNTMIKGMLACDLYIKGNYYSNGSQIGSSILVKENIVDFGIQYAEGILRLRPVMFDYIESYGQKNQIGLIAEEVEEYFPEVVNTPDKIDIEKRQIKSIDYSKLVAPLIKMVQIQQSEIDEQKRTIQDLEERVSRLESLLEKCIGPSKFKNEE